MVVWHWQWGMMGTSVKGKLGEGMFEGNRKAQKLDCSEGCTTAYIYIKAH